MKLKSDFLNGNILEDKSKHIDKKACCIPLLLANSLSLSTPARLCSDPSRLYKEIRTEAAEQEEVFLEALVQAEGEGGGVGKVEAKVEDIQQKLEGTEEV